jgi:hypothetical protein
VNVEVTDEWKRRVEAYEEAEEEESEEEEEL